MKTRNSSKTSFGFAVAAVVVLTTLALMLSSLLTKGLAAAPFSGAIVRINQVTVNSQNEPTIVINPTNPRNLMAGSISFETGTGQCAAYASTDRGKTWTHQILPNATTFTAAGDPIVAFDANGTAYYLCMNVGGTTGGIPNGRTQYVWRSIDGGQNWIGPALAMGSPSTDDDKGHLAVDDHPTSSHLGNVYAVATRAPCGPGELRFARSTDGGMMFEPDQQVNDAAAIAFSGNVAIGADGSVYVSWGEFTPCGPDQRVTAIMIDKSTDGGQSFGALTGGTDRPVRIGDIVRGVRPDPDRGGSTADLGTHPNDPNIVYAVWNEDPAGSDDSDIMFSRSLDGGNTWSSPSRVNDDVNPTGEFFSQFWPTMAVDPSTGEIDIVWYSDQNDPDRTDTTPLVDLYFASSTDGGVNFSPSIRLTPISSTRAGFFGDYIDIDSLGGVAHPIWTDTTFFAGNDQNIATTQVGGADLRVSKVDLIDPVVAGEQLVYAIDVTNDGPADAFGVKVIDTLPNGVTFTGDTDSCLQGPPGILTCSLGDLQSGAIASFDIIVHVDEDLVFTAGGPVTISNTATVSSDQDDPDFSNNIASEDTLVKAEADIAIVSFEAIAPPTEVLIGQAVDLTLRKVITNHGPSSPVDVTVSSTATAPSGSTNTPVSSSETALAVAKDELRTIDEIFTITCGVPGTQTFSFANTIQLANPADIDPELTNNITFVDVSVECILPVAIDIKPRDPKNTINLRSRGQVPVAVLSTPSFDAPNDVDRTSLTFGRTGSEASLASCDRRARDVNHDGLLDLICNFYIRLTGFQVGDTEGILRGETVNGILFEGRDSVRIVPPSPRP